MSSPRKPPAYLRYLQARLKPLTRTGFWASTVGLVLVLIGTGYYWQHPEWLKVLMNNQAPNSDELTDDSTLSSEELAAVMADIDSSSVLLAEFDTTRAITTIDQPNHNSDDKKKPEGLFSQLINQQLKTESKPRFTLPLLGNKLPNQENGANPFAKSTPELTNHDLISGSNSLNNSSGDGLLTNSPNLNQNSSLTARTITNPIWDLNSSNTLNESQQEVEVNPWQITVTNSVTPAANDAQASDNQQDQVSQPTSTYPTGQTTFAPVLTPSVTKFPRSRPKPITSNYANPDNSSVPSQLIPRVPTASPAIPITPVIPGNYGQYSTQPSAQPNLVPDTESKSTLQNSGLQESQLNESGLGVSR